MFKKKNEENLFWIIRVRNTSAAKSIMNLSHTLYFIADAKVWFCKYSNDKHTWVTSTLPPPLSSSVKLSWQKPQYTKG